MSFKKHLPKLVAAIAVAGGLLGFRFLAESKKPPDLRPPVERGVVVRVVPVASVDLVPRAVAYGAVRPQKTWRAVGEVGGRVVELNSRLRAGAFMRQGELLFVIDAVQYRIEVARAEASVESLKSQLAQLDLQKRQFEARLALEKRQLELATRELARLVELERSGGASMSEQEQQNRVVLDSEEKVLSLEQSIELHPTQSAALQKQIAVETARLERAQLDVARCRIVAPFDGRVASLDAEQEQVITAGETLCTIDAVDIAEVPAPFGLARLGGLRGDGEPITWDELASEDAFQKAFDVDVKVRLAAAQRVIEWPGRLLRIEQINADTRSIPFVVGVDDPYAHAVPGVRPPLIRGLYVEVELSGRPQPGRLILPRSALRQDGTVPVADAENRLVFVPIKIAFMQGDFVVVRSGIEEGARVVASDLVPAVEGMLLRPTNDDALAARLRASATGAGDVR